MVWNFFGTEEPATTATADSIKNQVVDPNGDKADEAFECDYERDCTPLYRALENAIDEDEFEPIVKFLDTGYWPKTFFADPIPPKDQVKTWVTRFDPVDANKVKWSQLPLHLAIVCGAPPSIIGRLVKLYPQALRCTDDQHMLPLHLALRHGADDEIVAYLLMQFPDAVNAKGKSGRTAIDCALRAKDKLRGKILEIFIDKTKGKRTTREAKTLKLQLETKTHEYVALKNDLEAMSTNYESMKALKAAVEGDLITKIQELEQAKAEQEEDAADKVDKLESDHLLETLELQKKIELLEEQNRQLAESEKQIRDEEATLRLELEAIQGRVAESISPDDWRALKTEVETLQAYRLKTSRSQTQNRIDMLRNELSKTMEVSKQSKDAHSELTHELAEIKKNVEKLGTHDVSNKTSAELNALRSEVETLRAELKERAEASRTKVELSVLKKAMEMELRNNEGKTKGELEALRKAVSSMQNAELETKTNEQLSMMKAELQNLKRDLKNRQLVKKTKQELQDINDALANQADDDAESFKVNAAKLQKTLDLTIEQCKSNDTEVIMVNREVSNMKDEIKKRETTNKILAEVEVLKGTVEEELKKSEGKTQQELIGLKKVIKSLTEKELHGKDVEELNAVKAELSQLKQNLKEVEYAAKTQREVVELKKALADEIKNTTGKTEQALATMKAAVDAVDMEQKEGKSLKKSLADEIKQTNNRTEQELLALKKALDSMDVKKIETKNRDEWDAVRHELESMKTELKIKQEGKDALTSELETIKRTVQNLGLDRIKSQNNEELLALRQEMDNMRNNLKERNEKESALQEEIETLKKKNVGTMPKKKGLKKFFQRAFSKKTTTSGTGTPRFLMDSEEPGKEDEAVTTIAPPSLGGGGKCTDTSSDDDDSVSDEGLLAKLSQSFEGSTAFDESVQSSQAVPEEAQDSSQSDSQGGASGSQSAGKPPLAMHKSRSVLPPSKKGFSFRKSKTMMTKTTTTTTTVADEPPAAPSPMVRTISKTCIGEDGQVEIEEVVAEEEVPEPAT